MRVPTTAPALEIDGLIKDFGPVGALDGRHPELEAAALASLAAASRGESARARELVARMSK